MTNVLVVEDSLAIRKILKRMLGHPDLAVGEVYEAADGAEALERLPGQNVQLILSDINMPNMDGIQLLSALKAKDEYKHIPVVMITTEAGQTMVKQAMQLGANGYIRKPFSPDEIREKLISYLVQS